MKQLSKKHATELQFCIFHTSGGSVSLLTGLTSQVVFPSKFAVQIAVNVMLTLNFPLIENKTTFQIQYLQI